MTILKLALTPGVDREGTAYSAEGKWYDGDKIRFRSGNPEKIGGWQRLSNSTFLGTCRSMENWSTLDGNNYVGLGNASDRNGRLDRDRPDGGRRADVVLDISCRDRSA